MTRSWFPTAWRVHTRLGCVLTAAVIVFFPAFSNLSQAMQLIILLPAMVLVGIPHGAVDHLSARNLLSDRFGRQWPVFFFPAYLIGAALVLLWWFVAPKSALIGFLLLSAFHFGWGDRVPNQDTVQGSTLATAAVRGFLVLGLPIVCFPHEVLGIFNLLLGANHAVDPFHASTVLRQWAWLPLLVAAAWGVQVFYETRSEPDRLWILSEHVLLVALLALAPPLISFGVYFFFWHSGRHILRLVQQTDPYRFKRGFKRFYLNAAPLSLVTCLSMLTIFWAWEPVQWDTAVIRIIFQGLSALTVPHMIVTWLSDQASHACRGPSHNRLSP
ncbi:MAG: Brp/Blh family beta-carotene 15,15'-dioxygenase [Acidobacteriota bacterium]|nr:Brp/Blh family beta-carotene 15,15'-dioxygenase [Acidobacteriota bacterium]